MNIITEQGQSVAEKIVLLNKEYQSRLVSKDLQILQPYLQAMETLAILKTTEIKTQPFALALAFSSIGAYKSASPLGVIGPALERILFCLDATIKRLVPKQSIGQKKLLIDAAQLVICIMMVAAAIGTSEGLANNLYEEETQREIDAFGLELMLQTAIFSNAPYHVFHTIAEISHVPEDRANQIAEIMTFVALLLTLWTLCREKGPERTTMILSLGVKITKYATKVEKIIELYLKEELVKFDECRELIVIMKQIQHGIEIADPQKVIDGIENVLKLCNVTPDLLEADIRELCLQTKTILGLLKQGGEEDLNTVTGIWQAG